MACLPSPGHQRFFEDAIDQLHAERRYRVFADLERMVGKFPRAIWRSNGRAQEIIVWCSNEYLGMGRNEDLIAAFQQTAGKMGSGAGGTRNISGTSDGAAWHRAAAHHTNTPPFGRADRRTAARAGRDLGCAGHPLCRLRPSSRR